MRGDGAPQDDEAAGDAGVRELLHEVAAQEQRPPRDLAKRAVQRLRLRRTNVGHVNEVFETLRKIFAGLSELLGGGSSHG